MVKTATITIVDEVNCFISGINVSARKALKETYSYFKVGYFHSPKYKMGIWNGKKSLFNDGWFYTNLITEETLDILKRYGYEVDIVDEREKPPLELEPLKKEDFPIIKNGKELFLRYYQLDAVNLALENTNGIFEMGTGSGKTWTCAAIAKKFSEKGKVLVVVPTTDLVTQTARGFRELNLECGEFSGTIKEPKDITVTTWQSLNNYRELFGDVVCVICDEAHGAQADVLFDIISTSAKNIVHRYGFTGTVPTDILSSKLLNAALGDVLFTKPAKELQDEGYLTKCFIDIIQVQEPKTLKFEDYHAEYKYLVSDETRLNFAANFITKIVETGNTVVIMKNIKPAEALTKALGENAIFISGKMSSKKRQVYYDKMSKDSNHIYVCIDKVFAVGIDIPDLHNLIFYEVGKSFTTTIQAVGRVLRLAEGKETANLYDLCSSTKYSKTHLTARKRYYKEAEYPFKVTKVQRDYADFRRK